MIQIIKESKILKFLITFIQTNLIQNYVNIFNSLDIKNVN